MTDDGRSLTVEQLAERWQRRPQWITKAARAGDIPGAWKLGHLWRFRLVEIEAYELAQQIQPRAADESWQPFGDGPGPDSIFALTPLALKRLQNKQRRELGHFYFSGGTEGPAVCHEARA
ncbi:hypothetical protein GCM10009636_08440 [Arthrobacter koreensis]